MHYAISYTFCTNFSLTKNVKLTVSLPEYFTPRGGFRGAGGEAISSELQSDYGIFFGSHRTNLNF